jgi:hypothetical protein
MTAKHRKSTKKEVKTALTDAAYDYLQNKYGVSREQVLEVIARFKYGFPKLKSYFMIQQYEAGRKPMRHGSSFE